VGVRQRETTLIENSQLEGFRWQPYHQARVLWANNWHSLNQAIKETSMKKNQVDSRSTTFGMKRKMKIGIWNVQTLRSVHNEALGEGKSWGEVKQLARNRIRWQRFVDAICP
jgi:hypothetical protein